MHGCLRREDDERKNAFVVGPFPRRIRVGVAQEICTRLNYEFRLQIAQLQAEVPRDDDGNPQYLIHASELAMDSEMMLGRAQSVADDVMAEVAELGGDGGVILVTPEGHALYSFNTTGMYRGRANSAGLNEVAIFGGEEEAGASNTPDH